MVERHRLFPFRVINEHLSFEFLSANRQSAISAVPVKLTTTKGAATSAVFTKLSYLENISTNSYI
jgi:hypothetical protein